MTEWHFAQTESADELAILHQFSMKKRAACGNVEIRITVREFATPREETMRFMATTDTQVFQKGVPFHPAGWGSTLLKALGDCIVQIKQFPYEGEGQG